MIEKIKSAISNALYEEFHTDTNLGFDNNMVISPETIDMNIPEPGFTYRCIDPQQNTELKGMVHINHSFSVNYYPITNDLINEQLDAVAERLYSLFEIIYTIDTTPIPIKCTNCKATKSDNVLVFTFDVESYMTQTITKEDTMSDININQEVN